MNRKTLHCYLWISLIFITLAGCHGSKSTDNKTTEDAAPTVSASIAAEVHEQATPEPPATKGDMLKDEENTSSPNTDQRDSKEEHSQAKSADSEEADTEANEEKKPACRVLLTYNAEAKDIFSDDGKKILEGQGNDAWSELITFEPSGVHVQKVDGTLAYIEQQFFQIYPVEFKYEYKDNKDLRWHAWYIRNLKTPAKQDAILFYYMPHSCYIREFSARDKMYKLFGSLDFREENLLFRMACDDIAISLLPQSYHTQTQLSLLGNVINIAYTYKEKIFKRDHFEPDRTIFLTIEISHFPEFDEPSDFRIQYFTNVYAGYRWLELLSHEISNMNYPIWLSNSNSASPFLRNMTDIENYIRDLNISDTQSLLLLIKDLTEDPFILNPIFYPKIHQYKYNYLAKDFSMLKEIDGYPLPENYPPVFLLHSNETNFTGNDFDHSYYFSKIPSDKHTYHGYSPRIPISLKHSLDKIMRAPDGCGEFDWRTMTFRGQGQTYKLEHPDELAGIAWITTDDEIPLENLVKLPIVNVIEKSDASITMIAPPPSRAKSNTDKPNE